MRIIFTGGYINKEYKRECRGSFKGFLRKAGLENSDFNIELEGEGNMVLNFKVVTDDKELAKKVTDLISRNINRIIP